MRRFFTRLRVPNSWRARQFARHGGMRRNAMMSLATLAAGATAYGLMRRRNQRHMNDGRTTMFMRMIEPVANRLMK